MKAKRRWIGWSRSRNEALPSPAPSLGLRRFEAFRILSSLLSCVADV